jgi:glycosyltransferase involved in cell wall biosynthesis
MTKMTVIIPTFNRERYVQRAIDSALNQSFRDCEIVVVDDGSTDNTRAALSRYANRIRYIYQNNAGPSAARNMGIRASTSEWLAFLDSDDEWTSGYLAAQMERARDNSSLCMQSTDAWVVELDGQRRSYFEINRSLTEFRGRDYVLKHTPFSFVIQHGPWQIGSTIIRRNALDKAGAFDVSLSLSEDFDLMARVSRHGDFGMIRERLVNVYRRNESMDSLTTQAKKKPIQSRESNERIYEKLEKCAPLKGKDRNALRATISANRRAIGNLLVHQGDPHGARDSYARAVRAYPSLKSIGKFILFTASHFGRSLLRSKSTDPSRT